MYLLQFKNIILQHNRPKYNIFILKKNTVYAKISGYVKYERLGKDKKQVSVYENL